MERRALPLITEKVSTLKINKLSKAQYEREYEAGRIDTTALYLTPDETPELIKMTREEYDNALATGTLDESAVYLIPDDCPDIIKISQEDYDKLVENGTISDNTIYLVPDDTPNIVKITQEEYDRALAAGTLSETTIYLTPDNTPEIIKMTQEDYDRALAAGNINESTIYLIPDKEWTKVTNTSAAVEVVVEDKVDYYFPHATQVDIYLPTNTQYYECWLFVGGADATIIIHGGTCLGITEYQNMYHISCAEISIKDGRYLIATDCIG